MKIREGLTLKKICGEYIIVSDNDVNFTKIININESAAYLWKIFADKEFTLSDACNAITEEYDIDYETAMHDMIDLFDNLASIGVIEK